MKNLLLIAALSMTLVACNSSSSDNKGGGAPAPAPAPAGPDSVDVNQLDANEQSTETLSDGDHEVALETVTDLSRASYLNSQGQEKNTPPDQQNPVKGFKDPQPQTPNEQRFFDGEALSQTVLDAVNRPQICNPTVTMPEKTQERNLVKFTTSGSKCPMVMESNILVQSAKTDSSFDINVSGDLKFVMNESALPVLKQQSVVRGDIKLNMQMKMKIPSDNDNSIMQSGSGTYSGTYTTKKLGTVEMKQSMIFAMSMDYNGAPNQMVQPIMRGVSQIELKALNKRAVLTMKIDSQAAEPMTCSLNKKVIDLDTCAEIGNKIGVKEAMQSSNPPKSSDSQNGDGNGPN